MSFHLSADEESITVNGGILRAKLRNEGGDYCDAEINLDDFIGNNDGTHLFSIHESAFVAD